MDKEFIPYEQASALKGLGFDEPCLAFYLNGHKEVIAIGTDRVFTSKDLPIVKGPLYQQAFRWFREKYGLYSWITMELGNKSTFCWVLSGEHTSTQYAAYFHTYEEAELACLKKLIELIK
jgi:hypothetical protein